MCRTAASNPLRFGRIHLGGLEEVWSRCGRHWQCGILVLRTCMLATRPAPNRRDLLPLKSEVLFHWHFFSKLIEVDRGGHLTALAWETRRMVWTVSSLLLSGELSAAAVLQFAAAAHYTAEVGGKTGHMAWTAGSKVWRSPHQGGGGGQTAAGRRPDVVCLSHKCTGKMALEKGCMHSM